MPELLAFAESRRARGLTLEAVAEATKISLHFLRAIEEERFQDLPGGVYNLSYIRQYAECTGIDELAILGKYAEFLMSFAPQALPRERKTSGLGSALRRLSRFFRRGAHVSGEQRTTQGG